MRIASVVSQTRNARLMSPMVVPVVAVSSYSSPWSVLVEYRVVVFPRSGPVACRSGVVVATARIFVPNDTDPVKGWRCSLCRWRPRARSSC